MGGSTASMLRECGFHAAESGVPLGLHHFPPMEQVLHLGHHKLRPRSGKAKIQYVPAKARQRSCLCMNVSVAWGGGGVSVHVPLAAPKKVWFHWARRSLRRCRAISELRALILCHLRLSARFGLSYDHVDVILEVVSAFPLRDMAVVGLLLRRHLPVEEVRQPWGLEVSRRSPFLVNPREFGSNSDKIFCLCKHLSSTVILQIFLCGQDLRCTAVANVNQVPTDGPQEIPLVIRYACFCYGISTKMR